MAGLIVPRRMAARGTASPHAELRDPVPPRRVFHGLYRLLVLDDLNNHVPVRPRPQYPSSSRRLISLHRILMGFSYGAYGGKYTSLTAPPVYSMKISAMPDSWHAALSSIVANLGRICHNFSRHVMSVSEFRASGGHMRNPSSPGAPEQLGGLLWECGLCGVASTGAPTTVPPRSSARLPPHPRTV